jgi:hypothetical protein
VGDEHARHATAAELTVYGIRAAERELELIAEVGQGAGARGVRAGGGAILLRWGLHG